jgi:hypothetical protein
MRITSRKAVLRAALIAGVGVGGGLVIATSTANAAPRATDATSPVVVSRISVTTGPQTGGTQVTLQGKDLATADPDTGDFNTPTVTFTVPAATKDGTPTTATVASDDVQVLSDKVLVVETPTIAAAGKATVTVTNGSDTSVTTKAPVFTFTAAAPEVTDLSATDDAITSEAGGTLTITGTYLGDKTTKVLVGGKAAVVSAGSATSLTATAP